MGEPSTMQGPGSSPRCAESLDEHLDGNGLLGCHCSKSMCMLRTLHIEGLPPTMTATELSKLFCNVQYAEAAPEAVKDDSGEFTRRLHCYVVFTDHLNACQAKQMLQPRFPDQPDAADALRVRFCKPQNVVPLCTPTFRAFVTAQWTQAAAAAKACPEYKKASCKVNALFVSKLHQHITTARLTSLFGKFGKMLACEVQYHSDGRSAGHGVVIYETIEDAEKALAGTNGYRLEGRTIEVTPLRLKKLPSKLEHLKHRIKRQPLSGDMYVGFGISAIMTVLILNGPDTSLQGWARKEALKELAEEDETFATYAADKTMQAEVADKLKGIGRHPDRYFDAVMMRNEFAILKAKHSGAA
eukprot:gene4044-4292_t